MTPIPRSSENEVRWTCRDSSSFERDTVKVKDKRGVKENNSRAGHAFDATKRRFERRSHLDSTWKEQLNALEIAEAHDHRGRARVRDVGIE